MEDLNLFPKKLLIVSAMLIIMFLGVVSITFFYHPVVPFPCKIDVGVNDKSPAADDSYTVHVTGAPHWRAGTAYKVKIFIKGEGYFSTLMPQQPVGKNTGEWAGVMLGIPGIKKNDVLNGVAYKDSVSPLPLIRLMFK